MDAELRRNTILKQLPDDEFGKLRRHLRVEEQPLKHPAYEPGKPISDIYFPLSAVFSVVAVTEDERVVFEVATIG